MVGTSREQSLQIPPVWLNFNLRHFSRPADRVLTGLQYGKLAAHGAVQTDHAGVGFLQLRIQRDAAGDALQFNDGRSNHEGNVSRAVDGDDGFGIDAAGVGDRTRRGGQGYGINILLVLFFQLLTSVLCCLRMRSAQVSQSMTAKNALPLYD